MRTRLHRPACRIVTCSVFAFAAAAVATPATAFADESLIVTTPYPAIETQPGSSVTLDITVTSAAPEVGALLNPDRHSTGIIVEVDPAALPSTLPLTDSLLLAWWQLVAIVGGAVFVFAAAYLTFMRQEVRA